MSSIPVRRTSSSEGDSQPTSDERKRKRMISNRESARRSRMRKQQHLDELINQAEQLKSQNSQIDVQINLATQQFVKVESENAILRAQLSELTERLQSMNSVLRFIEEVSGMTMDIPELPDPLLKPLQLPCAAQPIMANADMLQF
ncbi:Ocs element-binding factor [Musa troglodytarum]|uniref:Ocs element-binding factor n=1 Tax=Musa troglodytarum TaxID=320322 RepID=A0A9E7EQB9_9LILI|nr:Ocs element-binding factor [Musa troglodytarum]